MSLVLPEIHGRVFIIHDWTGNSESIVLNFTTDRQGANVFAENWVGADVLRNIGFGLETSQVNRFVLNNFISWNNIVTSIYSTHRIENSGANIGRLVANQ